MHQVSSFSARSRALVQAGTAAVLVLTAALVPTGTAWAEAGVGGQPIGGAPMAPAPQVQAAPQDPAPGDGGAGGGGPAAPAVPGVRDGRAAHSALASCWDVKQVDPAAADGRYWLYTPGLGEPQQFYCDMTTDGGGWVLIGRGREGWAFLNEGQGSTAEVAGTVAGTAAFAPKHLTAATVNGLLNGRAVQNLADGIRVRRAANGAGSSWQELRLAPSRFPEWSWVLNGGYPLSSARFDAASVAGGSTALVGLDGGLRHLNTTKIASNGYLPGFAYGSTVTGSTAASSYLWARSGGGNAVPFAQVFLRPTVRWSELTFETVGGGLAAQTVRPVAASLAEPQPAGVSGLANGFSTERDTEVRALAQVGSTMFVGGNFARVDLYQQNSSVAQSYLAAFDVTSGQWVPGFRPTLNGKVNALVALPSGLLAVGGEFTTVNGATRAGLVVLDPSTGQVAPGFSSTLEYRRSVGTTPGTVTGLAVSGSTLYLAGAFTHVAGGGSGFAYTKRGARLDAASGRPDAGWNPAFDGTPIFVTTSPRGDRVYFGGFMATMNDGTNPAMRFAVVTTTAPARPVTGLAPWVPSSTTPRYQQTGLEVGDRFWLGGSEHSFFAYERASFALLHGNITRSDSGSGGDFQAAAVDGGVIYGSCHCILSNNYDDGRRWPTPTTFDRIGSMRYVGAYDATTGRQLDEFLPQMRTRAVRGSWALAVDSRQCLWEGGDTTETKSRTSNAWQTSGGFSRWCRTDTVAPSTPTGLRTGDNGDGTVTVSWTGSTDNASSTVFHRLYSGDQVVWSGYSWKATLPITPGQSTFRVRAYDRTGNLSATSQPVTFG